MQKGEYCFGKKITIADIARKSGVSKTTVSHVLTGKRPVSVKTKKRVLQIIEELGYYPNYSARSLSNKKTGIIGFVGRPIPDTHCYFSPLWEFIFAANTKANKLGYKVLFLPIFHENTEELLEISRAGYVDGLILMEIHLKDRRVELLKEEEFPFVMIGRCTENSDVDYVDIDAKGAVYEGVKYLIKKGHKNIAFVGVEDIHFGYTYRAREGYAMALRENNISLQNRLIHFCLPSEISGRELATKLIEDKISFSALVSCEDIISAGMLKAFHEKGVRVPEEISLLSFGNSVLSEVTNPSLTVLNLRAMEMSEMAVETLVEKLRDVKGQERKQRILSSQLVERKSVASICG